MKLFIFSTVACLLYIAASYPWETPADVFFLTSGVLLLVGNVGMYLTGPPYTEKRR